MKIFAEFKEVCPNHRGGYNPGLVRHYKRMINLAKKNETLRSIPVPEYFVVAKKRFEELAEERRFKSADAIPEYVKGKLQKMLNHILAEHHPDKIELVGSYCNGKYVDEMTPAEVKELRKICYHGDKEVSDFDFLLTPCVNKGPFFVDGLRYDLTCLGKFYNEEFPPIKLYENGKILI